eukprot:7380401-Prymnesium_polylepis.2
MQSTQRAQEHRLQCHGLAESPVTHSLDMVEGKVSLNEEVAVPVEKAATVDIEEIAMMAVAEEAQVVFSLPLPMMRWYANCDPVLHGPGKL